jgi:CRISPR-associated protein (TIGR03985 family)
MLKTRHTPDIETLHSLVRFSPIDNDQGNNLRKAVRLWYTQERLNLEFPWEHETFTDRDWRNHLDQNSFTNRDKLPIQQPNCITSKTIKDILFGFDFDSAEQWADWQQDFVNFFAQSYAAEKIQNYMVNMASLCPFHVTGQTLLGDLRSLVKKGCLSQENGKFRMSWPLPKILVPKLPEKISSAGDEESIFLAEDFDAYQRLFSAPIRDIQRFYIHAEYRSLDIAATRDARGNNQRSLRQLWAQPETAPVELKYHSASQNQTYLAIVYPLLIHYYQRAFYLCAYGQQSNGEHNWHNYRIDRIAAMRTLDWQDRLVPSALSNFRDNCSDADQIIEIQEEWENAYGGDFYQPQCRMLLRFNRDFHDRYIKNTFRHQTFRAIPYAQVARTLHEQHPPDQDLQVAMARVRSQPQDAYYRMDYRLNDHSVLMRLRAWSPNVEVLFPLDLRQRMADDIRQAWEFYQTERGRVT